MLHKCTWLPHKTAAGAKTNACPFFIAITKNMNSLCGTFVNFPTFALMTLVFSCYCSLQLWHLPPTNPAPKCRNVLSVCASCKLHYTQSVAATLCWNSVASMPRGEAASGWQVSPSNILAVSHAKTLRASQTEAGLKLRRVWQGRARGCLRTFNFKCLFL